MIIPTTVNIFGGGFRRELVNDGCLSSVIHSHKRLIQDYVRELSTRGVLDDRMDRSRLSTANNTVQMPLETPSMEPNHSIKSFATVSFDDHQSLSEMSFCQNLHQSGDQAGPSTEPYRRTSVLVQSKELAQQAYSSDLGQGVLPQVLL